MNHFLFLANAAGEQFGVLNVHNLCYAEGDNEGNTTVMYFAGHSRKITMPWRQFREEVAKMVYANYAAQEKIAAHRTENMLNRVEGIMKGHHHE